MTAKTEPVEDTAKGVTYKCTFCNETKGVIMVLGYPLCPVHNQEIQEKSDAKVASPSDKATSKSKLLKKMKSKKDNKIIKTKLKAEAVQEVFVLGSISKVNSHHKKVKSKISKIDNKVKQLEQRIAKLNDKISKAEARKVKAVQKKSDMSKCLSDEELLSEKCLKGKTIQLFGKTKEGGTRVRISGKWFTVSGHLVGEESKLVEIAHVKEKRMKRPLRKEFGY